MTRVIRIMPQTGIGAFGGAMGGYGGVSASTYYTSKLQDQKQISSLQLGYERQLAEERINRARLEERAKNPYGLGAMGAFGGVGMGLPGLAGFGGVPMGLPLGGIPMGMPMGGLPMGGIPAGFGGAGQTNITNQSSTGGNQTVTNSNVHNVSHRAVQPPFVGGWGSPMGGFGFGGGGGFLSSLLGALI